jgi:hypothetical protein
MLMTKERRSAIRTLRGWAISVLQETGAIRECEEHGWMRDRADPHARQRAFDIARQDPPSGLSGAEASRKLRTYWPRSATHVLNARRTAKEPAPGNRRRPGWPTDSAAMHFGRYPPRSGLVMLKFFPF